MAQARPSRENFFGFLTDKKVTYHRDVAKERRERKAEALADRRERLAVQKLKAEEKAAEAKIAEAQRKIDAAKSTLKTAEKKADKGGMSEAKFEEIKARMEREIAAQQAHKAKAQGKNPAVSASQYRLAQSVLSGTNRTSKMTRKVAQEIVDRTPAKLRSAFMKGNPQQYRGVLIVAVGGGFEVYLPMDRGKLSYRADTLAEAKKFIDGHKGKANRSAPSKARTRNKRVQPKKKKKNPAEDAATLYQKFHGRAPSKTTRIEEPMHVHRHLAEIGDLVRLVIDTPTGLVSVLEFSDNPGKVVKLASSEKDPKTGQIVGKQLYLRGGDQEVNLKGLKMDSPLWIRDKMELGRLHEFKRGDPPLIVNGEKVKGSITYRTRKGMDDFKLIDYWHRAGEETVAKAGPAARPIVVYDYRNKKLELVGGHYEVKEEGIIN